MSRLPTLLMVTWQAVVIAGAVFGFYALAIAAPYGQRVVLLIFGTGAFIVATVASYQLGETYDARDAMIPAFGGLIVLTAPMVTQVPWSLPGGAAIVVGAIAVQLIWAVHRYPTLKPVASSLRAVLPDYIKWGLRMASGYSVIAVILLIVALLRFPLDSLMDLVRFGVVVVGYFIAGTLAALVAACLRNLTRWPVGTALVGLLAGAFVYGTFVPILSLIGGWGEVPMTLPRAIALATTCGSLVGMPTAQWWRLS